MLIQVTCTNKGMMRYGRAWGLSTLVEVVDKGREKTPGSPAEAAISRKDLDDLRKLVKRHGNNGNCPFQFTDPDRAKLEIGAAHAELEELGKRRAIAEVKIAEAAGRCAELEEKNAEAEKMLSAAEKRMAEAEARANAADDATKRAEAKLAEAQRRIEELEGRNKNKK